MSRCRPWSWRVRFKQRRRPPHCPPHSQGLFPTGGEQPPGPAGLGRSALFRDQPCGLRRPSRGSGLPPTPRALGPGASETCCAFRSAGQGPRQRRAGAVVGSTDHRSGAACRGPPALSRGEERPRSDRVSLLLKCLAEEEKSGSKLGQNLQP